MKLYKRISYVILITIILLSVFALNNNVYASTGVDYVLSTWNNYPKINSPNFYGGWGVSGDILYTSNNIHWTGFWNAREQNATDRVMEFQLRLTGSHQDPFGWTFRHREISSGTFSFYAVEISPYYNELTLAKINSWTPNINDPVHGGPLYHGVISSADGYYTKYRYSGYGGALRNCSGSILSRVPISFSYGTWYNMKIDVTGNRIKVWYNGELKIDYTDNDNPLTYGGYGPYTASQPLAQFREIYINGSSFLNTPPNIVGVSSPVSNSHYWAGSSMNISGVVNEPDGRGTVTVKYAFDSGTETDLVTLNSTAQNQNFSKAITVPTSLSDGLHNLKIWAKDSENGVSDVVTIPIYVDKAKVSGSLTFSNISNNSMTINWTANGNPSGTVYELYDASNNQLLYSGSNTTFLRTGLSANTQYQYKVRAKDSYDNYSSYQTGNRYTLANRPLSKGYDNITSNSVRLLWNANGNSSSTTYHYEIRKKSDNSIISYGTVNGTSVTVTGLTGGHEQYRYFVRAINGDGIYTNFTELIIPSLNVYQKSNYAKAEWAIEMEDSDILTMTSFEDGEETPNFVAGGNTQIGNQSLVSGIAYTGNKSIQVTNTMNMTGNNWWWPSTESDSSIFALNPKRIPNGTNLSITYKVRATGGTYSYIVFSNDLPHSSAGITFNDYSGRQVKFAERVDFSNPPSEFSVYVDGGTPNFEDNHLFTLVTSHGTNHDYGIIFYRWSSAKQKFVKDPTNQYAFQGGNLFGKAYTLRNDVFQPGEPVLHLEWVGIYFDGRTVPNTGEWITISSNAYVDHPRYNFYEDGFGPRVTWKTNGTMQVDDIKFGYATKAELYRDGTKVYEGFLSDYDDYAAVDKAAPNPVSKINVANNGNTINVTFDTPSDKGTTYNYQVKAVKHNGDVIGSEVKPITVISGIKGYSYVIDSIPNTTPDNIVEVTAPNINHTINPNVKNYIHIKVIDNEGNVSDVFHQEISIPTLTVTPKHQENYIKLDWNIIDTSKTYKYDVYKKLDGQSLYDKISSNNSNKTLNDYTGQDVAGPTKPTIIDARMINNGNTIHMEYTAAEDRGTKYYYYVEGTAPNTKVQSNIAEATIKTGLKGYSIVVDQNPNTVPDNTIETTELSYNINQKFYQKFYIHVAAVDNVGNISEVAHYECVDTIPPTITVTGNVTNWTNQDVVLTATASDNESGLKGIKLPDGTWVYSDTAKYTVTSNGSYTFTAEDNFGNQKSITIVVDKIDKTPPYNTSIIINNDALYTNNRDVVLTISAQDNATGVSQMRFKTENSPWSAWVPYGTTFNYTMDAGFTHQGTNRVYAQFKDGVGNVGGDAYDSIVFDNIAPSGEIVFNKNTVNTRNINLTINAYDINPASADIISGLNSVRFRELQNGVVKQDWTSWEQHNFTRNWILSDGDGVKVIEMEIKDNAGNIGKVSKTIVLDTLFIKDALFTDIVNPPLGNPELPTSEIVKVKKGYEFTFIVKTSGDPDNAIYTFNGQTGSMDKVTDNLFTKTLKVDVNDDTVNNEVLPINITISRNDGTHKSTTLKVHIEGSANDDYNINLTN